MATQDALLVVHGGGPTAVINASLFGAVDEALKTPGVGRVLGALGGMGGISFVSQLLGTLLGVTIAIVGALLIYGVMRQTVGLRLTQEEEHNGADLAIHKISATAHEVQL